MPELPEVEVVRRGLAPFVTGARVASVEILDPRSLRRHAAGPVDFAGRLTGARLRAPERRGKFLWIPVADADDALLIHLGMSGQVLVDPTGDDRHLRVRLALEDGTRVDFADQRVFGSLALDPLVATDAPGEAVPSQVAHIARDPLDPAFSSRALVRRLRGKRTEVKRALLDQTLVSGIGNIYADEALWAARVHPRQPTDTISAPAALRLIASVREVMERALAEGGTSFDELYVHVNGQSGYFSRSLNAYGRRDAPCARCGRLIVRETFMNRGSHFCPACQRVR